MNTANVLTHLSVPKTVISIFEETAAKVNFKEAIVNGKQSLSYYALNQQANKLAHYLRSQGVGNDRPVGILLDQSIDKVVALLAVLKAGAAYVPLDPSYPVSRIRFMLEDTSASFLITSSHYAALQNTPTPFILLDDASLQEKLKMLPGENVTGPISPEQLAYIIFTSGSTGHPKGVLTTHRNLLNFTTWFGEQSGIGPQDITIQFASTSFDASVMDLWIPLLYGATVHLYDNNKVLGEHLERFINERQITMLPFMSYLALASLSADRISDRLKVICFGGESLPDELIGIWTDKVKLIQAYGPTETTVAVCSFVCEKQVSGKVIGKAGANNILYVLDDALQPVPKGSTGELYVGGEQVTSGYLNNEAATHSHFIKNPFMTGAAQQYGWTTLYKTGDLVTVSADGNLIFEGRKDEQVKIRGHRIEPGEIEAIIGKIPGIRQGIVKVHEDKLRNKFLAAYLVAEETQTSENPDMLLQSVRSTISSILPTYMIPGKWKWLSAVPTTANGKIDKKALVPDEEVLPQISYEGITEDDYEMIFTKIWAAFLHQENFQPSDNFFAAGAHSLMLAQVYAMLPEKISKWVKLPDFFLYPTPKEIADILKQRMATGQLSKKEKEQQIIQELLQDSKLDNKLNISGTADLSVLTAPTTIFLTGATGFVGSQLLFDLLQSGHATIYCLVRAKDAAAGIARLQHTFSKFLLPWPSAEAHRIKIITGDLSQPHFGIPPTQYADLVKTIAVIYHSGSSVSYIEPYPVIKKANIDGLTGILSFATAGKPKPLILLSSMGVFSWGSPFTGKVWCHETDDIDENIRAVSKDLGYIRSKWVMEKMMQQAMQKGLPVINFRLGFAVCNSQTGATATSQWWSSLVRACVEMGTFPLVMGLKDELTTVDYMSQAIIHIARNPAAVGKNFHLSPYPENDVSLTDFFARINEYYQLNLKGLPYAEWLHSWKNDSNNPLFPLLSLFTDDVHEGRSLVECYEQTYYYTRNNTATFLEGTRITPPAFDQSVMTPYLRFMGVLPA